MEGGFQKFPQLFVANGYCVFEDNVCVDLSGVLDGRPNYTYITFSELFVGPCVDRLEVMDKGPDYATSLLSKFCAEVRWPPVLAPSGGATVKVHCWEKESLQAKRFRLFFFFFLFFFFVSFDDQSGSVTWTSL